VLEDASFHPARVLGSSGGPLTRVRATEGETLAAALRERGIGVEPGADRALHAAATTERVGTAAFEAGVPVLELTAVARSLEEASDGASDMISRTSNHSYSGRDPRFARSRSSNRGSCLRGGKDPRSGPPRRSRRGWCPGRCMAPGPGRSRPDGAPGR